MLVFERVIQSDVEYLMRSRVFSFLLEIELIASQSLQRLLIFLFGE